MNKKLFILLCLLIVVISGCSLKDSGSKPATDKETADSEISETQFVLGTIATIQIRDHGTNDLMKACFERLVEVENLMSTSIEGSDIWNVNHNGQVKTTVSEKTAFVIEKGIAFGAVSEGRFDISIGPLVDLWKIGTPEARIPEPEEITEVMKRIDYKKIMLDGTNVSIMEGMSIDLGGIAKGYAADQVAQLLVDSGVKSAIINLGGNIKVIGSKEGGLPFKVGVQNPFDGRNSYLGIISTRDMSVVSSGDYERYFEENGKRYHHIFDKQTGYPVDTQIASVSVVTPDGIKADALSTVFFSIGVDKGFELARELGDISLVYVMKDKTVFLSKELQETFELKDNTFNVMVK
ncbi:MULTISPECIES: FAD:protein FMN transferase [unclassified Fusibacter]|uniref:FAD:protein FMN transferase n=1 Tax=unclassified Fusibacter TaxID=2624464 RepID=UPI0010103219|nr:MULTISPECIES: FAD:protein FMN transferase [unclassified Fusibacter]MCK8059695.1 FAD:protein FMN transferase [Fusibacter sp. A2]NPE21496.1 FAD:protein FMN transferase [Fusibacter sp. A1]RXV61906.1 FAD:protein FMN transferase [Fusibacter sp. A1]